MNVIPVDFQAIFESIPGNYLVIAPDSPHYTIMAVSDGWLLATNSKRQEILGRAFFEVFPQHTDANATGGLIGLRTSLQQTIEQKRYQQNTIFCCEIFNTEGLKEERSWRAGCKPLVNQEGAVSFILLDIHEEARQVNAEKGSLDDQALEKDFDLFMQAPVAICIVSGENYIVKLVNEGMLQFLGRTPEMMGKPLIESLPEARLQGLIHILEEVRRSGAPYFVYAFPGELVINGVRETRYFDLVFKPYNPSAKDTGVNSIFCVAHNVTELVLARKKIEENEAVLQKKVEERTTDLAKQQMFLNSILDASFSGIYALKAKRSADERIMDFEYLFVNNQVSQMLQLKADRIIGTSMLELIPENMENGFFDLFCEVLSSGKTIRDETYFITKHLKSWFDFIIVPIDKDTLVVTIRDITESKKATEVIRNQKDFLDTIVNHTSSALLYCQSIRNAANVIEDFEIGLANDKAAEILGFGGTKELSSMTIRNINRMIGAEDLTATYISVVEMGKPQSFEYYLSRFQQWYATAVVKLNDGFLVTFTNISQTKELQLQLEKMVAELSRSNQNLEEFAHAASHDLKEPIRKIHFFTHHLKDQLKGQLKENEKRSFDRIEKATERMGNLIDDLLLYSHVSQRPHQMERVDLNEKLQRILEDLELDIQEKGAIVHIEPLPVVLGFKRQLQQLFQNLISNALKYSKAGVPPRIDIRAEKVRENAKSYHLIEVRDYGIGFEQEYSDKIFQMFTRLHGKNEYSGTGVGLSIAKKVADNHNGFIRAESEPGVGATFKVFLPEGGSGEW